MDLKLYNTLSRQKEVFEPLQAGKAGVYTCGPTVYAYATIGNMRSYIFADTLRRILSYAGFEVKHVMNITDVGHLVSDGDEGEDKMEVGKAREGLDAWAIARKYTDAFFDHAQKLNILKPDIVCKATDYIEEQIALIQKLEDNDLIYTTDDGVYFDTTKFEDYGKMAKLDIEGLQSGHRIDDTGKKNKTDFALWKFSPPDKQRDMEWDSPWGRGFPGWHIECSAMSMKYLGDQFDIHTGGIDHIPVHHTNEIAQSEGATGCKPFVRYWMHGEFLHLDGAVKISKSKGHVLTVDTLIAEGYDPLSYRYLCLTAHYRSALKFSYDSLTSAEAAYKRLMGHIYEIKREAGAPGDLSNAGEEYRHKIKTAFLDDMNTAVAIAELHQLVGDETLPAGEKLTLIEELDGVLGLQLMAAEKEKIEAPADVMELVAAREAARNEKRWEDADKLRAEIEAAGFVVKDTDGGSELLKAKG